MLKVAPGSRWLVAALAAAAAHALWFRGFVSDDAFIAFRYAARFAQGEGLTWTAGPPVEGYTDLLWVLWLALGHALGVDPVIAARGLGLVGGGLAITLVSLDDSLRPSADRAASGGLLLAASAGMACWAMGGLEHGFLAGLMAATLVSIRREAWFTASALLTAVVLTRADGAVLWLATVGGVVLAERRLPPALVLPGIAVAGQELFRLAYYGDWVPNSARAKVSGTLSRAWRGVRWTGLALLANGVLVGAAAAASQRVPRGRAVGPLALVVAWCAYVALVGGDSFVAWRQIVPVLPALALVVADAGSALPRLGWVAVALASLAVQLVDGSATDARDRDYIQNVPPLARTLTLAWGHLDPLLAVDAAGALPYYTGFRSLDMLGLNDRYIAEHPPTDFGDGPLGHDLGDADYVWSRAPDILAYRSALGNEKAMFPAGLALERRPDYALRYAPVRLGVLLGDAPVVGQYYVRRDGPLGIQALPGVVDVPAWLFANHAGVATTGPQGVLGVGLGGEHPAKLDRLPLGPGTWAFETRPAGVVLDVLVDGRSVDRLGAGPVVLTLDGPAVVEVLAWAPAADVVRLRSFVARRGDGAPTHALPQGPMRARAPWLGTFTGSLDGPAVARVDHRGLVLPVPAAAGETLTLAAAGGVAAEIAWLRAGVVVQTASLQAPGGVAQPIDLVVPAGGVDEVQISPERGGLWRVGRR